MEPDRHRRTRDLKPWPLCAFPRAGRRVRRLPFPRRRETGREAAGSTPASWQPPTAHEPDPARPPSQDAPTRTPSPPPPPATTRPPTPPPVIRSPPPPPPPLLNSTRDPRLHRSGRLRHVKGMLGLRRMETIDEDDGVLEACSDVDDDEEGERGRQRTSIHGGEDFAAGEGGGLLAGGGSSGSSYTSFPSFDSMSRLRRGMMVQFCREDEMGSLSAWEYPPRKAARLF
ncbi:hypothetical protein QBC39DRAFT_413185 [Podospora conica]|nr:hypothetical protein QBC39DRAFT_413185 [Schizothecium conicum]